MIKQFKTTETFLKPKCRLAEGPTYDPRNDKLYWVDITGNGVCWTDYTPAITDDAGNQIYRVSVNHPVGVLGLTETPGKFIVGAKSGFGILDLRDCKGSESIEVEYTKVVHISKEQKEKLRFNDGYIDAKGRFFAGSMIDLGYDVKPIGVLYRYDPDGSVHIVQTNVSVPNGLAWSPDNKIMYFTDSPISTIWKYDYDIETGVASNRQVFVKVQFPGLETPEPDGLCVSTDGCVWTAIFNSSTVRRYSPEGEVLEEYLFPTPRVTCPAFVGPNLDVLVVTSMSLYNEYPDYDIKSKTEQGEGGNLFQVKVSGVQGIPRHIFPIL